jgi:basic amino acid/polyamine antiporter, APA family
MVLQGAVLTFYSFVGFEDMINVVEEVKDPQRTFPSAIVIAMIAVTLIYLAVSVSAVSVLPWQELAVSRQPLVDVVRRAAPAFPPLVFSLIALFAITNTALLNYIMGSRIVYGMARQGLLPRFLGTVHPVRRTPHYAILCLMGLVLVLGLGFDIRPLAKATSVLLMAVFALINGALLVLQRRRNEPKGLLRDSGHRPRLRDDRLARAAGACQARRTDDRRICHRRDHWAVLHSAPAPCYRRHFRSGGT